MVANDGVGVFSSEALSSRLAGVRSHGFERKGFVLTPTRFSSIRSIRVPFLELGTAV